MGLKRLAEETIAESLQEDAYFLVSQTEEVDGEEKSVVRRVPFTISDPDDNGNIVLTIG